MCDSHTRNKFSEMFIKHHPCHLQEPLRQCTVWLGQGWYTPWHGATGTYNTACIAKHAYLYILQQRQLFCWNVFILFTVLSQFISKNTTIILFRLLICNSTENIKYIYIFYSIGVNFALSEDSSFPIDETLR